MKYATFSEFSRTLRELLQSLEDITCTRETFCQKLTIIIDIFTAVQDNFQIIFSKQYYSDGRFVQSILRKIDQMLVDSSEIYERFNTEKRLDPDTKKICRKLHVFLPHVKKCVQERNNKMPISEEKTDTPNTPVLRRSPRLKNL